MTHTQTNENAQTTWLSSVLVISAFCVNFFFLLLSCSFQVLSSVEIHAWTFNESASSPFTPGQNQAEKLPEAKRMRAAHVRIHTIRSKTLTPFTKQPKPINDQKKDADETNGKEIWLNRKRHFYRKRREWIIKQQKSGTEHCATSFVITFEFLFHHSFNDFLLIGRIILSIASRLLNAAHRHRVICRNRPYASADESTIKQTKIWTQKQNDNFQKFASSPHDCRINRFCSLFFIA